MTEKTYKEIIDETMAMCTDVLFKKKGEYATEQDYLHIFNVAAELENITPKQALAGMMAKHTVSIYDMCNSAEDFPIEKWNEKIVDHINYLLILRAMLVMEG